MRLDEWQKYIDTQFLADEPISVQEPILVQEPVAAPSVAIQSETVVKEEASPSEVSSSIATIEKHSPDIAIRTRRRSQSLLSKALDSAPLSDVSKGLFRPLTDLDTEIPTFQSYLPSSHAAAHSVQSDDCQHDPLFIEVAEAEVNANPEQAELPEQNAELVESISARRTPASRAKNARNIRPETLPQGLSASELWAQVPRQVQTLLSLERLNVSEEKEVAQSSYKRQFQEKRHELIERLLDPILSLEDTARLLNVCPTTVRRYTNKGILTHYRKEPDRSPRRPDSEQLQDEGQLSTDKETRQRRFRLSDILIFLEAQRTAIESESLSVTEKDI